MRDNYVKLISVECMENTIQYKYEVSDTLKAFFNVQILYKMEYFLNGDSMHIEEVPVGICSIPFVCNILPIIWLTDALLEIDYLDRVFYDCIENVKAGYKRMYPQAKFLGELSVKHIVDYPKKGKGKAALFFSAGVDSWYSYLVHRYEKPTLITLWGADLSINNNLGWKNLHGTISTITKEEGVNLVVIKSSFRSVINSGNLDRVYRSLLGDTWWHGMQHGIAIIAHSAVCNYIMEVEKQYFAASFSPDFNPTCASSPIIDNYIRFFDCEIIHDGYIERNHKIKALVDNHNETNYHFRLNVCWEQSYGENCCKCEKCLRTIMGIRIEGGNPIEFGFPITRTTYKDAKKFCNYYDFSSSVFEKHYWHELKNRFDDNLYYLSREQDFSDISWFRLCDIDESPSIRIADGKFFYFPFREIPSGSRVVIYGAGRVGKAYVSQLINCNYVASLLWVDKDAEKMKDSYPMVRDIASIKGFNADYVVIAIANKDIANAIKGELVNLEVNPEIIIWKDPLGISTKKAINCVETLINIDSRDEGCKKVLLINTPDHGNLGDHAIAICEHHFIMDNFPEYELVEITGEQWDRYKNRELKTKDYKAVFITGGGNAGDVWESERRRIKEIISMFFSIPVIMFPNSFYWKDERNQQLDYEFFLQHANTIFFHRERNSYEQFKRHVIGRDCFLFPDMVLYDSPVEGDYDDSKRKGVLFCWRKDIESIIGYEEVMQIEKIVANNGIGFDHISTVLSHSVSINDRNVEIRRVFGKVREAELLITDRLHAMLFAYHTKTPCIVVDSMTGKTRGVYEWVNECSWIRLVKSNDITIDMISEMIAKNNCSLSKNLKLTSLFRKMEMVIKEKIHKNE